MRFSVHLPTVETGSTVNPPASCPRCGTADWSRHGQFLRSVVDIELSSVAGRRYKCRQCRHEQRVLPPGLLPRKKASQRVRCVAALLYLLGLSRDGVVSWFRKREIQISRYGVDSVIREVKSLATSLLPLAQYRRNSLLTSLIDVILLDGRTSTISLQDVSSKQYVLLRDILTLLKPLGVDYNVEAGKRKRPRTERMGGQREHETDVVSSGVTDVSRDAVQQPSGSPIMRGGRPRGTGGSKPRVATASGKTPQPPKLVCWESPNIWELGVDIPDDWDEKATTLSQAGVQLDSVGKNRFCLRTLNNPVCVMLQDQQIEITVPSPILIFRMASEWKGIGELADENAKGFRVVVAPENWKRMGRATIAPESVNVEGYLIHFFRDDERVQFHTPEGKLYPYAEREFQIQFVGTEIDLKELTTKPFFTREPPRIRLISGNWSEVDSIVVGEEGPGSDRRRIQFTPRLRGEEQFLPDEIKRMAGGWFFVRLYRGKRKLASQHFRFLAALEELRISPCSILPSNDGHQPVEVILKHTSPIQVVPASTDSGEVLRDGDGITRLVLPTTLESDETRWRLQCGAAEVEIGFALHRVCWALSHKLTVPDNIEWTDKVLQLSHNDFANTSELAIILRRPFYTKIPEVRVWLQCRSSRGPSISSASVEVRVYRFRRARGTQWAYAAIPLYEYHDASILRESTAGVQVVVEIDYEGGKLQAVVAQIEQTITDEKKIQRKFKCLYCGFSDKEINSVVRHAVEKHWKDQIEELSYEQLQMRSPNLPRFIYKCYYCDHYEHSNSRDITGAIARHVERQHGKSPRFIEIDDVDEIRRNLKFDVPYFWRCKRCRAVFRGNEMFSGEIVRNVQQHLCQHHEADLVTEVCTNEPI